MRTTVTVEGSRFRVATAYSPVLVSRFQVLPGRAYRDYDKTWSFPLVKDLLLMVTDILGVPPTALPAEARDALGDLQIPSSPPPDLSLVEGWVFRTAPYVHQRANLARLLGNNRWLIADEQGCGKSHSVCNRLLKFFENGWAAPGARALILCPKSVMSTWKNELWTHAGVACDLVEGDAGKRRHLIRDGFAAVKVANWELLLHSTEDFLSVPWTVVVGDEVHKVKSFTAQVSKVARRISAKADFVWALSGTPAPNGLEDWLGVLSFVDPFLLPCKTKTEFEARYVFKARVGADGPWKVAGYRNTLDLHRHVARVTSRYTKAECLDLPPKVFSTRAVRLEGEQRRVYNQLRRDAVARLASLKGEGTLTVRNVVTESLRLLQVVGGFVPDDAGVVHELNPKAKYAALADLVEEAGDSPVVVWCAFKEEVRWLASKLPGRVVTLTGDTPGRERARAVEEFQAGQADYFIGTAAAGGSGITLHRGSTTVYYSRNYNLADYLQSQDRQHRIGQSHPVTVARILAEGTVDEKVESVLERKRELQEMLLLKPEEML